jgi:hypothetical protein
MRAILLYLPFGLPLYAYGTMLCLSVVIGRILAVRIAERDGLDPKLMDRACIWALAGALVGQRLLFVATSPEQIDGSWTLPFLERRASRLRRVPGRLREHARVLPPPSRQPVGLGRLRRPVIVRGAHAHADRVLPCRLRLRPPMGRTLGDQLSRRFPGVPAAVFPRDPPGRVVALAAVHPPSSMSHHRARAFDPGAALGAGTYAGQGAFVPVPARGPRYHRDIMPTCIAASSDRFDVGGHRRCDIHFSALLALMLRRGPSSNIRIELTARAAGGRHARRVIARIRSLSAAGSGCQSSCSSFLAATKCSG